MLWPDEFGFTIGGGSPVIITTVTPNSVAQKSGLQPGDQIIEIESKDVRKCSIDELKKVVKHSSIYPPSISVLSRIRSVELEYSDSCGYGLRFKGFGPVYIHAVYRYSAAYELGVRPGDLILEINNVQVNYATYKDIESLIERIQSPLHMVFIPRAVEMTVPEEKLVITKRMNKANQFYKVINYYIGNNVKKKADLIQSLYDYTSDKNISKLAYTLLQLLENDQERRLVEHIRTYLPPGHWKKLDIVFNQNNHVTRSCMLSSEKGADVNNMRPYTSLSYAQGRELSWNLSDYNFLADSQPRVVQIQRNLDSGSLGVILQKNKPVIVHSVNPGGPAEAAGLRAGDFILEINGQNVRSHCYPHVLDLLKNSGSFPRLLVQQMSNIDLKPLRSNAASRLSFRKPKNKKKDHSLKQKAELFKEQMMLRLSNEDQLIMHQCLANFLHHRNTKEFFQGVSGILDEPHKVQLLHFLAHLLPQSVIEEFENYAIDLMDDTLRAEKEKESMKELTLNGDQVSTNGKAHAHETTSHSATVNHDESFDMLVDTFKVLEDPEMSSGVVSNQHSTYLPNDSLVSEHDINKIQKGTTLDLLLSMDKTTLKKLKTDVLKMESEKLKTDVLKMESEGTSHKNSNEKGTSVNSTLYQTQKSKKKKSKRNKSSSKINTTYQNGLIEEDDYDFFPQPARENLHVSVTKNASTQLNGHIASNLSSNTQNSHLYGYIPSNQSINNRTSKQLSGITSRKQINSRTASNQLNGYLSSNLLNDNAASNQLNGHTSQLNGHTSQLNGHSNQLNGHSNQLNGHTSQLNGYTSQLNGHTSQLNDHTSQLNGHSIQLNGHSNQMIGQTTSQLSGHTSQLNSQIARTQLDNYIGSNELNSPATTSNYKLSNLPYDNHLLRNNNQGKRPKSRRSPILQKENEMKLSEANATKIASNRISEIANYFENGMTSQILPKDIINSIRHFSMSHDQLDIQPPIRTSSLSQSQTKAIMSNDVEKSVPSKNHEQCLSQYTSQFPENWKDIDRVTSIHLTNLPKYELKQIENQSVLRMNGEPKNKTCRIIEKAAKSFEEKELNTPNTYKSAFAKDLCEKFSESNNNEHVYYENSTELNSHQQKFTEPKNQYQKCEDPNNHRRKNHSANYRAQTSNNKLIESTQENKKDILKGYFKPITSENIQTNKKTPVKAIPKLNFETSTPNQSSMNFPSPPPLKDLQHQVLPTTTISPPPPPPPPPHKNGSMQHLRNAPSPPPPPPPELNNVIPLKRLNWEKLSDNKLENTVWTKIKPSQKIINFDELEELFSTKPTPKLTKKNEKKKKKRERLLCSKKVLNLGILLGHLKLSTEEIYKAVLNVDHTILTDAHLQTMLTCAPDPNEVELFKKLQKSNDVIDLSIGDEFTMKMLQIPNYAERLRLMLFKLDFSEKVKTLIPDIESVLQACKELRESQKLLEILEVVLSVGNYMNKSYNRISSATGFKIGFLPKLISTKTSDNNSTLLHIIVKNLLQNKPEILLIHEDLKSIARASKVSSHMITQEINLLKKGMKEVEDELYISRDKQLSNDRFAKVMSQFVNEAHHSFHELLTQYAHMQHDFQQIVEFFGDEYTKTTTEDFFGSFAIFLQHIESTKEALLKARSNNKRRRPNRYSVSQERLKRFQKRVSLPACLNEKTRESLRRSSVKPVRSETIDIAYFDKQLTEVPIETATDYQLQYIEPEKNGTVQNIEGEKNDTVQYIEGEKIGTVGEDLMLKFKVLKSPRGSRSNSIDNSISNEINSQKSTDTPKTPTEDNNLKEKDDQTVKEKPKGNLQNTKNNSSDTLPNNNSREVVVEDISPPEQQHNLHSNPFAQIEKENLSSTAIEETIHPTIQIEAEASRDFNDSFNENHLISTDNNTEFSPDSDMEARKKLSLDQIAAKISSVPVTGSLSGNVRNNPPSLVSAWEVSVEIHPDGNLNVHQDAKSQKKISDTSSSEASPNSSNSDDGTSTKNSGSTPLNDNVKNTTKKLPKPPVSPKPKLKRSAKVEGKTLSDVAKEKSSHIKEHVKDLESSWEMKNQPQELQSSPRLSEKSLPPVHPPSLADLERDSMDESEKLRSCSKSKKDLGVTNGVINGVNATEHNMNDSYGVEKNIDISDDNQGAKNNEHDAINETQGVKDNDNDVIDDAQGVNVTTRVSIDISNKRSFSITSVSPSKTDLEQNKDNLEELFNEAIESIDERQNESSPKTMKRGDTVKRAYDDVIKSSRALNGSPKFLDQVKKKLEEEKIRSERPKLRRKITKHEQPLYALVMKETIAEYELQREAVEVNMPNEQKVETLSSKSELRTQSPNFLNIMHEKLKARAPEVTEELKDIDPTHSKKKSITEPLYTSVIRETLKDYEVEKKEHERVRKLGLSLGDGQSINGRATPNFLSMLESNLLELNLISDEASDENEINTGLCEDEPLFAIVIKAALQDYRKKKRYMITSVTPSAGNNTSQQISPSSLDKNVNKKLSELDSQSSSDISLTSEEVKQINQKFFTSVDRNKTQNEQDGEFLESGAKPLLPKIPSPDYKTSSVNIQMKTEKEKQEEIHPHHIDRPFWNDTDTGNTDTKDIDSKKVESSDSSEPTSPSHTTVSSSKEINMKRPYDRKRPKRSSLKKKESAGKLNNVSFVKQVEVIDEVVELDENEKVVLKDFRSESPLKGSPQAELKRKMTPYHPSIGAIDDEIFEEAEKQIAAKKSSIEESQDSYTSRNQVDAENNSVITDLAAQEGDSENHKDDSPNCRSDALINRTASFASEATEDNEVVTSTEGLKETVARKKSTELKNVTLSRDMNGNLTLLNGNSNAILGENFQIDLDSINPDDIQEKAGVKFIDITFDLVTTTDENGNTTVELIAHGKSPVSVKLPNLKLKTGPTLSQRRDLPPPPIDRSLKPTSPTREVPLIEDAYAAVDKSMKNNNPPQIIPRDQKQHDTAVITSGKDSASPDILNIDVRHRKDSLLRTIIPSPDYSPPQSPKPSASTSFSKDTAFDDASDGNQYESVEQVMKPSPQNKRLTPSPIPQEKSLIKIIAVEEVPLGRLSPRDIRTPPENEPIVNSSPVFSDNHQALTPINTSISNQFTFNEEVTAKNFDSNPLAPPIPDRSKKPIKKLHSPSYTPPALLPRSPNRVK